MRGIFLLFFFFSTSVMASQANESGVRAAHYFEAKQYTKALDLYEGLLKEPLTPWQRSVIQYNMGCVLFAAGNPSEAIAKWISIPLGEKPFPLLARRIHTNIAAAKISQVEQMKLSTALEYEKAFFLLQQAKAYLTRAIREECDAQKIEGMEACTPAADLEKLQALGNDILTKKIIPWLKKLAPSTEKTHDHLIKSYLLALIEDPLQEKTVAQVLEEQKKIPDISTQDLETSLSYLQQKRPLAARFYFRKALFSVMKILRPAKKGLVGLLETAVETQHEALVLNRIVERMEEGQEHDEKFWRDTVIFQKRSVQAGERFKAAVFEQQQHDFQQGECQAHPWDEVLPLFDEGYQFALDATLDEPLPILELQEKTIEKWNRAIQLLNQPKKTFTGTCKVPIEKSQQRDEETSETEKPPIPMQQVLNNIQKMELEDRKSRPPPPIPKVERPW